MLLCLLIAVAMGLGREASTPTVAINHGTGKNDLVVSIGLTGGFAPPGAVFSAVALPGRRFAVAHAAAAEPDEELATANLAG